MYNNCYKSLKGNTFVRCGTGVALDDRGLTWDTTNCPPGGPFEQDLESFDYVSFHFHDS